MKNKKILLLTLATMFFSAISVNAAEKRVTQKVTAKKQAEKAKKAQSVPKVTKSARKVGGMPAVTFPNGACQSNANCCTTCGYTCDLTQPQTVNGTTYPGTCARPWERNKKVINSDDCKASGQICTCSNTGLSGTCNTGSLKSGLYCHCDTNQMSPKKPMNQLDSCKTDADCGTIYCDIAPCHQKHCINGQCDYIPDKDGFDEGGFVPPYLQNLNLDDALDEIRKQQSNTTTSNAM